MPSAITYQRHLADLPWQGRVGELRVQVRRLRCVIKRPKGQLGKGNRAARSDDHPLAVLAILDAGLAHQGVAHPVCGFQVGRS